ncbi:hypothetical protein [Aneurinibacillus terranovensis]|uniref:hypothetical protein n=1 Tax=Aneurinibacillus terranovensis TaxID=278991 RepID=UPI000408FA25|nr:hypothetical protein [Aneurinibacillus terranovensis]
MKKTSFYTWLIHSFVDWLVNGMQWLTEKIGKYSVFSRLKSVTDKSSLQQSAWVLFILVLANVFIFLFAKNMDLHTIKRITLLAVGMDVLAAALLVIVTPAGLARMARTSLIGRMFIHMFDPNK